MYVKLTGARMMPL